MHITLLYWLGLFFPGYVVVRLFSANDVKSGLLGVIALSYLAVFALLSPVSIVCYIFQLPLVAFSVVVCLAIFCAMLWMIWRGWWAELGKMLVAGIGLGLLVLVVDLILAGRNGAFLWGDAKTHVGRIRFLVEHGFTNFDPSIVGNHFFSIYHTNLLHALYASCAQVTKVNYVDVWFVGLVWAKLLVASGTYYLAWSIFGRQWVAWVTAIATVGLHGPVPYLLYPNMMAPYWILPIVIALATQACTKPCQWNSSIKIALTCLVMAQVHGLYAVIAGVVLGPVLGCVCIVKFVRRRADRWCLAACIGAFFVASPFVLVSKYARPDVVEGTANAALGGVKDARFVYWENGWSHRRFSKFISPRAGVVCLSMLAFASGYALLGERRKHSAILAAAVGTVAFLVYVPPICAGVSKLLGAEWILNRMMSVMVLGFLVLVPGAVADFSSSKWPSFWLRLVVSVLTLAGVAWIAPRGDIAAWPKYARAAIMPADRRHTKLNTLHALQEFYGQHLEPGTTVLTDTRMGGWVAMLSNNFVISTGIGWAPNRAERIADLTALLDPITDWDERRGLLKKYRIKQFLVTEATRSSYGWTQGHVLRSQPGPGCLLLWLDTLP